MFRSNFKIAWRSLVRRRFYTIVNIFGLSIGIGFTLLIGAYAYSEVQVNNKLLDAERLYLLESKWRQPGMGAEFKTVAPLAKLLREQFPDLVRNYYRWDWVSTIVSNGEKHFRDSLQIGDTTLVAMFGFPLLYGNKHHLFNVPDAVVITESKAVKYFGRTDVVGQKLSIENYSGKHKDFTVTGVLKNLPYNSVTVSVVPVNASVNSTFISVTNLGFFYAGADINSWDNGNLTGYVALQKGISQQMLEQAIRQLFTTNASAYLKDNLKVHPARLDTYNLDANGGLIRKMLWTVCFIALFILLMAVVNFVNITVGNSSSRLKEIGVRKVLGGVRKQLILQFLTESVILVTAAVLVSLCLYQLACPYFAQVIGKELPSLSSFPLCFYIVPVLLTGFIGLLAGLYPAFILSSFKSADSLKGKLRTADENLFVRRSLVGFQFAVATIVFAGAIVITQQVHYFLNTDLGYTKDQLINIALPRDWTEKGVAKMQTLRNELCKIPGVNDGSLCYSIPNRNSVNNSNLYRPTQDSLKAIPVFTFITDEKYASTLRIPVLAGTFFTGREGGSDSMNVVLNQKAVKSLGWNSAADAIGNTVRIPDDNTIYNICGVLQDYHFESKRESIKPLVFMHVHNWNAYRFLSLRLAPGSTKEALIHIGAKWAALMPAAPFEYTFMDETLHKAYLAEIHLESAAYLATGIAVIVVLLGVMGLVSLSVAKRTKEIGIRKVLGASVRQIVTLFIKEFTAILVIACVIA